MTLYEAQQQLLTRLYQVYDNREAANITDWVMEHLTGWKKIDRIVNKQQLLPAGQLTQLEQYTEQLLQQTPVQYVLQEAWFCGMPFYVDKNVLIPRPETEELVDWIVQETGNRKSAGGKPKSDAGLQHPDEYSDLRILDIGTGSGCIPVALKKKLPRATVYACDISAGALAVAQKNAVMQQTDIHFLQVDFLQTTAWQQLPPVHIIVSNPPYIPDDNKKNMLPNVLEYEPAIALFVPDNDPLVFYKAIADFGCQKLLPGGRLFVEIHEDLAEQTKTLFLSKGFTTAEIKKDFQGKDRMIKVMRN